MTQYVNFKQHDLWDQLSFISFLFSHVLALKSTFLVLDFGFDDVDGVTGLHIKGNGFTRQSFHKNLHLGSLKGPQTHRNHTNSQLKNTIQTCSCAFENEVTSSYL